jgi:hypothetical protein
MGPMIDKLKKALLHTERAGDWCEEHEVLMEAAAAGKILKELISELESSEEDDLGVEMDSFKRESLEEFNKNVVNGSESSVTVMIPFGYTKEDWVDFLYFCAGHKIRAEVVHPEESTFPALAKLTIETRD